MTRLNLLLFLSAYAQTLARVVSRLAWIVIFAFAGLETRTRKPPYVRQRRLHRRPLVIGPPSEQQ